MVVPLRYEYQKKSDTIGIYVKEVTNTLEFIKYDGVIKINKVSGTKGTCISMGKTCSYKGSLGTISATCNCDTTSMRENNSSSLNSNPISSDFDCPSWNKNIGDKCDDQKDDTVNDKIDVRCNCVGTKLIDDQKSKELTNKSLKKSATNSNYTGKYKYKAELTSGAWDGFPIRSEANFNSTEIYKCPKDATIYVLDDSKDYYKIFVDGHTGYISKNSLKRN